MSNPFITSKCTAEDAAKIIKAALALTPESGLIPWPKVEAAAGTSVGYNRGWLIVRYAWLAKFQPNLLVDSDALVAAERAKAEKAGKLADFDEFRGVLAPIVARMYDEQKLSWGEIMVRLGTTEGRVRKAYRAIGAKKDRGMRTGRGGRFVYDEPTLYLDNRKSEGAYTKLTQAGKPRPEDLLNYVAPAAKVQAKPVKAQATKPVAKKASATKAKFDAAMAEQAAAKAS